MRHWLIVDQELPAEQRSERSETRLQMFPIFWKNQWIQQKINLSLIDYAKAFDCVRHSKLWLAMRLGVQTIWSTETNVSFKLIKLISNLYDGQQAFVCTKKGDSYLFNIGQGVKQGCIVSPTLFIQSTSWEVLFRPTEIEVSLLVVAE